MALISISVFTYVSILVSVSCIVDVDQQSPASLYLYYEMGDTLQSPLCAECAGPSRWLDDCGHVTDTAAAAGRWCECGAAESRPCRDAGSRPAVSSSCLARGPGTSSWQGVVMDHGAQ